MGTPSGSQGRGLANKHRDKKQQLGTYSATSFSLGQLSWRLGTPCLAKCPMHPTPPPSNQALLSPRATGRRRVRRRRTSEFYLNTADEL